MPQTDPPTNPFGGFNYLVYLAGAAGSQQAFGGFSDASGLQTQSSTVTLRRGVINATLFASWLSAVRASTSTAGRTVTLTLLTETGSPAWSWILAGALPTSHTGPAVASKGAGDVALEEVTLSFSSMQSIPPTLHMTMTTVLPIPGL